MSTLKKTKVWFRLRMLKQTNGLPPEVPTYYLYDGSATHIKDFSTQMEIEDALATKKKLESDGSKWEVL
jgi:hypothetical protein